jgi:hypothetical protein
MKETALRMVRIIAKKASSGMIFSLCCLLSKGLAYLRGDLFPLVHEGVEEAVVFFEEVIFA